MHAHFGKQAKLVPMQKETEESCDPIMKVSEAWGLEKLGQSSHAIDKGAGAKIRRFLFVFYRNHLFFI